MRQLSSARANVALDPVQNIVDDNTPFALPQRDHLVESVGNFFLSYLLDSRTLQQRNPTARSSAPETICVMGMPSRIDDGYFYEPSNQQVTSAA